MSKLTYTFLKASLKRYGQDIAKAINDFRFGDVVRLSGEARNIKDILRSTF